MKLPIVPTAVGLLLGIVLIFVLDPYLDEPAGIALLFIICILFSNCAAWLAKTLIGKRK